MDIIDSYIAFEKKILKNYARIINANIDESVLEQFIDTYINAFYYHQLQTLDSKETINYNILTISKELNGKRIEIIYLNGEDESYTEIVNTTYQATFGAVIVDNILPMDLEETKVNNAFKHFLKLELNEKTLEDLVLEVTKNSEKKISLMNKTTFDSLELTFSRYKGEIDKYLVNLQVKAPELDKYSSMSISKNLKANILSAKKTECLFNLLIVDILNKIKDSEEIEYYFVEIPEIVLENKDELDIIISHAKNEFVRKHLVLTITQDSFKGNKRIINQLAKEYLLALVIDMSHVRELEDKLDEISDMEEFKYIIVDDVRGKDFTKLTQYIATSEREIFTNEFEKE